MMGRGIRMRESSLGSALVLCTARSHQTWQGEDLRTDAKTVETTTYGTALWLTTRRDRYPPTRTGRCAHWQGGYGTLSSKLVDRVRNAACPHGFGR
jgi:hypothetical protein